MIKKSLSKKILNKRSCDHSGRSPVNLISCLFLFFGLILFFPNSAKAFSIEGYDCTNINEKINSFTSETNYIVKTYYSYKDDELFEKSIFLFYTNSPILYRNGLFTVPDGSLNCSYSIYSFQLNSIDRSGDFNQNSVLDTGIENGLVNYWDNPKSYSTLDVVNIVNYVDNSDVYTSTPDYDIDNLNEYPVNSINIVSPLESNIKTNNGYFDVTIKGKIKIDFSESLLGNTLFPMTAEWIGDYIRRDFRYSVDGDVEAENNLTYLGVGNRNFSNYLIEYLNQFYQDVSLNVDKNKVGDVNTFWSIGVTGNMNEWSKKHYYNFIINTRLWCGYLNNDLKYNLSFTVPVAFDGGLTNVNPSEYKTISINDYSLSRGFYVDDDFDGIDDTSLEVIPGSEIEIIHPSLFPSTSTPDNFFDGDVVQNNNNIINVSNDSEISEEEKNGILNILDNGIRKTTTLLSNLKSSMTSLGDTLQGLFELLPEPVGYLFYSALCLSLIFFILSLRR